MNVNCKIILLNKLKTVLLSKEWRYLAVVCCFFFFFYFFRCGNTCNFFLNSFKGFLVLRRANYVGHCKKNKTWNCKQVLFDSNSNVVELGVRRIPWTESNTISSSSSKVLLTVPNTQSKKDILSRVSLPTLIKQE